MKRLFKILIFPFSFSIGFLLFLLTGKTGNLAYVSFRYLFVTTNGGINDLLSKLFQFLRPFKKSEYAEGLLGRLHQNKLDEICSEIEQNGFYNFGIHLSDEQVSKLMAFAGKTKTRCVDVSRPGVHYHPEKILFTKGNIIGPRYQFDSLDVTQDPTIRELLFDSTLREIAGRYLRTEPILDIVTMWWSVPFNNQGTAQSAQMYHFDMDRIKFLKFFFYLSDVTEKNGPHCYIRSTNNSIPAKIRKDRRIEDNELKHFFNESDILSFTGKKGTILAVDTRGLHKGKSLEEGERLLFQIQFSNSLFGAPWEKIHIKNCSSKERELIQSYPRTYQLLH